MLRSTESGRTSPSTLRREGDTVGAHRLVHIAADRIFLKGDAGPCQLRIGADGPPEQAAAPGAGRPAQMAEGIRQIGENAFEVDRAVIERALAAPGRVSHARALPESVDGRPVGIRLLAIRQDDPLAAIGIRNGDLLESINGYDLTDPEAMLTAYARLRTASSLALQLNRGGKEMGIDVSVR